MWVSWFVCSKWYIIASWCIRELSEYVSWNMWTWYINLEMYDPACFLTAPGLASYQAALKKAKGKLDLLTDVDML